MSQARNVTAAFAVQTYTITLTVQIVTGDSGSGSVLPAPPGGTIIVDKFGGPGPGPITQTYTYNAGSTVTVTASRTSSWFGMYITGACTAGVAGGVQGGASCQVTMDSNKTVFVTFQ
jgi:hypothetical protein